MAITWFRSRNPGRHATGRAAVSAAGLAEPQGLHAALAATDYDASYDHPGWDARDDAERELLMPATQRPPWETAEGQAATCRKCRLPVRLLGGDWTSTEYGMTNCCADLSAPYTPHEPVQEPDLSELTLTDKPLDVLRPEAATSAGPERAGVDRAGEKTAVFTPDFAEGPPQDRQRPFSPQDSGPPASAEMAPGPVAWLRITMPDGPVDVRLAVPPEFTGIAEDTQGVPLAEFALDPVGRIRIALDREALDAIALVLPPGREQLVYGGFRAPAVPADPDAAEHREVLERELDGCLEQARGVLGAAGNLGFISGALRQRNGEGVMDVFVARAALANAVENGDEAAALKAAGKLVDVVSELCGGETACSIANGIAPSEVAVARAETEPEPEAAAEPGEVADEAATAAGEAMAS